MKKEIFIHTFSLIAFFAVVLLIRGWFGLFWIGGILGTILPDIDHLVYVYFLRPYELTSQRVGHMSSNRDIKGAISLLSATRSERTNLVFHTAFFQIIFLAITFLVVTSSGDLFGRGLVLAFCLHLLVDQAVDLRNSGGLGNWFRNIPITLDTNQQGWYVGIAGLAFLLFAFFF
ncbi:hypothetical protein A2125_02320 [Candidatus Woesebacteria bacterium GWB1_43_5]|uniref:Uncharacterized protein n=1 Tax=Candidatus Woesebacteria bacterium GWB1_43_5 TaxID=1802474 RepID=A0A1F7WTP8_9BACT|nr:MAG: hypothetical protein A2125_02320 [Candidatus Woesebacteria bacterium GWB1_43_5]